MASETGTASFLGAAREGSLGVVARVVVSLASGLAIVAVSMFGAWCHAAANGARYSMGAGGPTYFRIRDEQILAASCLGFLVWCGALAYIWRTYSRHRHILWAGLGTLALGVTAVAACLAVDKLVRSEEEVIMVAISLLAGAADLLLWLWAVWNFRQGRRVVTEDNVVNVVCPECGYSLVGLRDLRCPECGLAFTIDELIRRQNFALPAAEVASKKVLLWEASIS